MKNLGKRSTPPQDLATVTLQSRTINHPKHIFIEGFPGSTFFGIEMRMLNLQSKAGQRVHVSYMSLTGVMIL
ncbi:MAG: hypothetical protein RLN96_12950, partial [Pseudomonadales bacterium]